MDKKKIIYISIIIISFTALYFSTGCGGGGVSENSVSPRPQPVSSKMIEINGFAGPSASNQPLAASPAYQINFINDYTITVSDIYGAPVSGVYAIFTGTTSFKITFPPGASSKLLMVSIKHKTGPEIFKKIIGNIPAAEDISDETGVIKIDNMLINEDSTIKTLIALSDVSKIPDTIINSTVSGKTDFETEFDSGFNDDNGSKYLNSLKNIFNSIVKVINSNNLRIKNIKNIFLNELNIFLNSYVELGQIYNGDDDIKQILGAPPAAVIEGMTINLNSSPADIASAVSFIKSNVSLVTKPPIFNPPAGLYKNAINISISSSTPGAFIKYTLDGSEPTLSNGTLYSSPLSISNTAAIKAAAFKDSQRRSAVTHADYTFDIPQKPSSPLVLNTISAGSSAFELKNIYDNGRQITQTLNTLNPYFEIIFRREDLLTFSLDCPPAALKIKLRVTRTVNTVPIVKTFCYGLELLADESPWDEEFSPPIINGDKISFNVKAGQTHFTHDGAYNIQLLILEGASYQADGAPKVFFNLPANVSGILNIKTGSSNKTTTPIISPAGGLHISSRAVSITCATTGAVIYYTDDGSQPTANSQLYSGAFIIESSRNIKAIALKQGLEPSDTASASFIIKCAAPFFYPPGGSYDSEKIITISCATSGVRIYYTIDGSQPAENTSILYSAPFKIDASRTVKAIAVKNGAQASETIDALYNITPSSKTAQPLFYPLPGIYNGTQNIIITCATEGAIIKYTLDGSDPLTSLSAVNYDAPIVIPATTTLKAAATKAGNENSNITSGLYTIKCAAPVYNPPAGNYTGAQQITITTTTAGASIYYTTDGTEPSIASNLYNGPLTVSESLTIRAVAVKTGLAASDIAPSAYVINTLPAAAGVNFDPASGNFIGGQDYITLSCSTAGASIRYTTDGSTPAPDSGILYSAPFIINSSITIKAIAYKTGLNPSAVSSAFYRFVPKVRNVHFDAPTKILSWEPVSVPGSAAVKYYVNGTAGAYGQVHNIKDDKGTTETSFNATILIPDEYAGITLNVSINVTAAAVKPAGGEARGEKSDQCEFAVAK